MSHAEYKEYKNKSHFYRSLFEPIGLCQPLVYVTYIRGEHYTYRGS